MRLVKTTDISTEVIDHHGLVAAVSRDLGIAEKINRRIGSKDPRRKIQAGVGSMLLDIAEKEAAIKSDVVGIGVGLYAGHDGGYGSAQRLYPISLFLSHFSQRASKSLPDL